MQICSLQIKYTGIHNSNNRKYAFIRKILEQEILKTKTQQTNNKCFESICCFVCVFVYLFPIDWNQSQKLFNDFFFFFLLEKRKCGDVDGEKWIKRKSNRNRTNTEGRKLWRQTRWSVSKVKPIHTFAHCTNQRIHNNKREQKIPNAIYRINKFCFVR